MILYITGSFPRLGDGIGDAAGKLYSSMQKKTDLILVTSDLPEISRYIEEQNYKNVMLMPNWKFKTIFKLLKFAYKNQITKVIIEYAGNGYKKDLAISFMPYMFRLKNMFSKNQIQCHLRLHEYTMCRPARKIFTWPLVYFSHHVDTPSYVEYEYLKSHFSKQIIKSGIGSNINFTEQKKKPSAGKVNLGFFGGIYPGKGIEKLIGVWSGLDQQFPDKFQFYLLGGFPENLTNAFDSYQKTVQKLIKEKNLNSKIIITGFLEESELEKKIDLIDIAVLPYEDGLTLRRGSFLAFLSRNVAVVTSSGDFETKLLFENADGIKMCASEDEMIEAIIYYTEKQRYYQAGLSNKQYHSCFEWDSIALKVLAAFKGEL